MRTQKVKIKKRFWFFLSILLCMVFGASFFFASEFFKYYRVNQNVVQSPKPTQQASTEKDNNKKITKPKVKDDTNTYKNNNVGVVPEALPSKFNFTYQLDKNGTTLNNFKREYGIRFPPPSQYADVEGVTCFRGNNYRNSPSFGTPEIIEAKLETVWSKKTGFIDEWTGVGWNGQPAIIQWDEKVREIMNLYPEKKKKDGLKEVIYATLDGNIYFLDLENGEETRPFIKVGFPHKGSVTVDPRGYPLLYAGQGIDQAGKKKGQIGYRIFSLIDHRELYFINGIDPYAYRRWGAFDSTPLIDKDTDTFIECGENGILYTGKLNTKFDLDKGTLSIRPDLIKYRYRLPKAGQLGTENSVAIFRNFAYFADNSGTLQCVDLNTLQPVWVANVTDDTDGTIGIDESAEEVSLYTACEVDRQGKNGFSYIRKFEALSGKLLWEKKVKSALDRHTNGGALASPVIGKNEIQDLVIFNIAKTNSNNTGGKLIALDKKTGREVWAIDLASYCWSSPVDIYTKEGKAYIIQCDASGNMFLIDGKSGSILDKINLGANIEGSPAVFNDMIVVGTRGLKIWGVRIK
ncbi:MAG: pyrrolo-quinoline quinone [Clostridia bacterium]|nr:pyrrolo-quinoline quinone [Clostridia bacterium]